MSKPYILPAAIIVAALPQALSAQSYPPTVSPPMPPFVVQPAPPPAPLPLVRRGGPANFPGDWFKVKDYPKGAKKRGENGRVMVRMSVSRKGKPTGCEVVASSGSAELDATTCALVMKRARFVVQLGVNGKPEPYTWPVVTRWVLSE